MSGPSTPAPSRERYRVRLREGPRPVSEGLEFGDGGEPALLPWSGVRHALAAEVGEPQGVRAVVFDLVLEAGDCFQVVRFAAEPGEEAVEVARALARGLPGESLSAELKGLAADGVARAWHPDLEVFEEAVLAALTSRRR